MDNMKTKMNDESVPQFLMRVESDKRREDSLRLLDIFREVTLEEAKMWGDSIVGFGVYHYKYASGREGDWPRIGFSPRKSALTIYLSNGTFGMEEHLSQLGKYKASKGCLYINKLEDVSLEILKKLIRDSFDRSAAI